ncbi:MAG: transcription antitermination factor NusB [Candidatus Omnitrophica bacterium]|nr:transcription antitermination factor NusB [Candidatus Omnitrophota bacterium]MDD5026871.1 transcription antitermination factor NusB [Candidatus Omnitrophota bacterium]MDD5661988.1 transcription antitermination factor NusB [Candidatus Omnitrophota bacterium]
MRKRTLAREYALQVLYQLDITSDVPKNALENFWSNRKDEEIDAVLKEFSSELVRGVVQNLEEIDKKIVKYAANWQLKRMAVVDRNIMRLGCFELLYREDIPPKVSINEAVELAKKFSGIESGKFVNAILDKVKLEKNK